jgi:hypothetical protein
VPAYFADESAPFLLRCAPPVSLLAVSASLPADPPTLQCLLLAFLLAFRDEVTAFSASETAQRRQEQERRAAERAEAEAAKLRQEAAAAQQREREQQLSALMDLNLQVCGGKILAVYVWAACCVKLLV